jgi:hypothetical protein
MVSDKAVEITILDHFPIKVTYYQNNAKNLKLLMNNILKKKWFLYLAFLEKILILAIQKIIIN